MSAWVDVSPILSREECMDCGWLLEWNGENWECPTCVAAQEDADREADIEALDRHDEDRADERAAW